MGCSRSAGLVLTKLLFVDRTLAGPIKAGIITGIDWSADRHDRRDHHRRPASALAAFASYVTLRLYVRL